MEAPPTAAEPAEEEKEEENVEKKENPHIPRHIGVPVMGMDLMAEMKARQERMAVKKVGGAHGSTCLAACVCVCVCGLLQLQVVVLHVLHSAPLS